MRIAPFAVLVLAALISSARGADRPNLVLINIDDLGYADIGPFGGTNRTPALDRMAREGRRFTSHYAAPVCSPSRAALLTGCYPKRVLPIPHVLFPGAAVGLHPDERTIAEVLRDVGYATACIGKWHVGDQVEFLPTRQGFDYYFGIPYSNDMGPIADGAKSNPGAPLPSAEAVAARARRGRSPGGPEVGITVDQPPLPLLENETVIERIRQAGQFTLTSRLTEKAVDFIREHRDRPFFLYLPHVAIHDPLYPSPEFAGRSPNQALGDWVEEVDASTGRILDTLRELGLTGKTLVVFTSDNGGHTGFGSNNAPLRGSKGMVFEGGIRACTLAWWPGRIPAGGQVEAITTHMDLLPTFAQLAGAPLPADRKLDGLDLSPLLFARDPATVRPLRDTFYYFRGLDLLAVRSGTWKLHLPRGELFDLGRDIGEKDNVATMHPEVVARLRAVAREIDSDLGLTGLGPGVRPLGRVARAAPILSREAQVRPDLKAAHPDFR